MFSSLVSISQSIMDSFKCLVQGILCVVLGDDEMQSCMRNESIQPQVESGLRVRDPLDFRQGAGLIVDG